MKENFKFILFVFLGALCLMTDAFYNGFPIVYSDTSTYIASGFELETPFDRPITYGLLIRIFSMNGLSLWLVVFFQGIILSYLIYILVRLITGSNSYLKYGLLIIAFLSVFTGISWTVSQIMPDVFTPIALVSLILVLFNTTSRWVVVLLYAIFFISVATHMSHILLFGILLLLIFSLRNFLLPIKNSPDRNSKIAWLLLLTITSVITMGSALSKSKHVFFMGALVEHGILKNYLKDFCAAKQYKLCAYKDSLPDRAYKFIWDEESPFYKIGGWRETEKEFNEIIYATLTQPKFIAMHLMESFKATIQQLKLFSINDGNISFLKGTLLYQRISQYFPHELKAYSSSKQNQSQFAFIDFFNTLFQIIVILGLMAILIIWPLFTGILGSHVKIIVLIFLGGIVLNAWDCGTFANAIDRLGCKMIWLVPFAASLLIIRILHVRDPSQ